MNNFPKLYKTNKQTKEPKTANPIYSRYLMNVSSSWPDMPCVMEWPWFRISRAKMFWLLLPQWNTPIPTLKTTVSRSADATVAQRSRNENYIWKNQTDLLLHYISYSSHDLITKNWQFEGIQYVSRTGEIPRKVFQNFM